MTSDPLDLEPPEDLEDPIAPNDPVPDAEREEPSLLDDEDDDWENVDSPENQLDGDEF